MIHSESIDIAGPHQLIQARNQSDQFALVLFDLLWDRYRRKVSYVGEYEQMIEREGGTFVNDHIAFRTFGSSQPQTGIISISRVFEALGYQSAGCYHFNDKHLHAIHFQHPNPKFPKLFISELKTWELPFDTRQIILNTLSSHRDPLSDEQITQLAAIAQVREDRQIKLMQSIVSYFHELPWAPPSKDDVVAVNESSQYAAWVLVHGYNVNHFTSLVNSHNVESLDSIDKTVAALRANGVPMKKKVEGTRGSKLRQSATEAVVINVDVKNGQGPTTMPWTYAYFELAERNEVVDQDTGKKTQFNGFLGPQATNLFEMTRKRKNMN